MRYVCTIQNVYAKLSATFFSAFKHVVVTHFVNYLYETIINVQQTFSITLEACIAVTEIMCCYFAMNAANNAGII